VHILYEFKDYPWGGGNQFLGALRRHFIRQGVYETDPGQADIILFNSIDLIASLPAIRKTNPQAVFIHRMDGVFRLHRKTAGVTQDKISYLVNRFISDATVFQSVWSMESHIRQGFPEQSNCIVILNAADTDIFTPKNISSYDPVDCAKGLLATQAKTDGLVPDGHNRLVKLVASSWSTNPKKGFDILQYLDDHLDFDQIEMSFIGNSPIKFKHIKMLGPLRSAELSRALQASDLFVSAVEDDTCSNALLEALACGLPCVARRSGANPEILAKSQHTNFMFNGKNDVLATLNLAIEALGRTGDRIEATRFDETAEQYISFMRSLHLNPARKRITTCSRIWFAVMLTYYGRVVRFQRYRQRILEWFHKIIIHPNRQ
jgi:glycosyltransferase involved in cell wall biosynthesis